MLPASDGKHRGAGRVGARRLASGLEELDDIDGVLARRNEVLAAGVKRIQDLYIVTDQRLVFRLAATDLFVEEAQVALGERAPTMWRAAIAATASAVALLIALSAFLVWRAGAVSANSIWGSELTLTLVQMGGAALIVFAAVKYLMLLSRSSLRENVSLVAPQHGIGFGRLYVYTNPDSVRLKDLQDAFGVDLDSTPIFLDIKAKETADTIYSKVTQDLGLSPRLDR